MKVRMTRDDGYEVFTMSDRTRSPEDGLYAVLKYELGFGGHVVDMTENSVTIRTLVFGKVDMTYVSLESTEEQQLMFTMLYHWYEASEKVNTNKKLIETYAKALQGNPFLITNALPIVLGGDKVRRTLLACLGLGDKPEVVKQLQDQKGSDIVALAELVREGSTWEEALEAIR